MVDTLSITLAQLNQSVGDIPGNAKAMLAARERAKAAGADLVVFPEMQLVGYPAEDLVLKPAFVARWRPGDAGGLDLRPGRRAA
jgi:NAD+ synthase